MNNEFENLQEKLEIEDMICEVQEIKALKKKMNRKLFFSVTEAIIASVICGVCAGSAINTVNDENASKALKGITIGTAALSTGLASGRIYKAANDIKSFKDVMDLHKKYKPLINLVENIDSVKNPTGESSIVTEACEKISDTETISEASDIALGTSKEIENMNSTESVDE